MMMSGRRADRPEGEPDGLDKDVRALWPVVKPGTVNVYRAVKNGFLPDLVATPSIHDETALSWYQQHNYIVWEG